MAIWRMSSLLSSSYAPALLRSLDRYSGRGTCITRFSTAAALEQPIVLPVKVEYTKLLINGEFVDAASGKTFPTLDPRTGELIAHVAEGDIEDVNRAVSAARKAFDEGPWPRMTAYERSRILLRFADLVEKHADEITALQVWDNGKPYEQAARDEIPLFIRLFRYYAGWADKIHGLTIQADGPHHVQTLHEPIGVAGQIIPWNFPLLMYAWKVGPALACGNTIVLKTAEQTPLSALYVSKLFHETGLPSGVLNIVSGYGPSAGAALASHMEVDKMATSLGPHDDAYLDHLEEVCKMQNTSIGYNFDMKFWKAFTKGFSSDIAQSVATQSCIDWGKHHKMIYESYKDFPDVPLQHHILAPNVYQNQLARIYRNNIINSDFPAARGIGGPSKTVGGKRKRDELIANRLEIKLSRVLDEMHNKGLLDTIDLRLVSHILKNPSERMTAHVFLAKFYLRYNFR